jgi:signal transduction histidine kinase
VELEFAFRRSLIWAGASAGFAGILLVGVFTRQALVPVRGLNTAARRLGKGDLSFRVPEKSKDEVGELAKTFNEMAAGLEEAAHQRRTMTADIAHELRTPLTNIQGYLEAIKDGVVQADRDTINILHEQTVHLSHLVEDLRLLAVADAGRLHLVRQPERLDLLTEDAAAAFRPRAAERRVALTVVSEAPPPLVELDRTRIRQVVANLVENALRHTPEGGRVTMTVSTVSGPPESVRLTVEDTGPGIPADQLEKIFDQFYRVDASRSRSTGGAGLGLTIVKKLVEAHGGTVHAESAPGQGARFVLEFPVPRRM